MPRKRRAQDESPAASRRRSADLTVAEVLARNIEPTPAELTELQEAKTAVEAIKRRVALSPPLLPEAKGPPVCCPLPLSEHVVVVQSAAEERLKPPGRKGHRVATLVGIAALQRYAEDRPDSDDMLSLSDRELARRAATYAQEIGLPDADLLDPEGSSLRNLAKGTLLGLRHLRPET